MATRRPLVAINGAVQELPLTDALPSLWPIYPGTSILNFGNFPGNSEASITIVGQTGILSTSLITAELSQVGTTTGHTVADHRFARAFINVCIGDIVPGVGFTIFGNSLEKMQGEFEVQWVWA